MSHVALTSKPLDLGVLHARLLTPAAGGVATFVGVTRVDSEPATTGLAYTAYASMAERQLEALAREVAERWPVERLVLAHRLGWVPAGEPSVFAGVATPHRAEAFAACRFLIDTLKADVVIWKCEHFADGTHRWPGT